MINLFARWARTKFCQWPQNLTCQRNRAHEASKTAGKSRNTLPSTWYLKNSRCCLNEGTAQRSSWYWEFPGITPCLTHVLHAHLGEPCRNSSSWLLNAQKQSGSCHTPFAENQHLYVTACSHQSCHRIFISSRFNSQPGWHLKPFCSLKKAAHPNLIQ